MRRRWRAILLLALAASFSPAPAPAEEAPPTTVQEWLTQQHQFFHRYLAVVRQAAHDYAYSYKTPPLLMPVAMDLFTGCMAPIHEAEGELLYPVLRQRMTPDQQQKLQLVELDQAGESEILRTWSRDLIAAEQGAKTMAQVAATIDQLAGMINRHIVLQEERVFPILELLTPEEQAQTLQQLRAFEDERFGAGGRARYEALLAGIERQIKQLAGRVW